MAGARAGDWRLNDDGTVSVGDVMLQPDEFELTARARAGHEVAEEGDLLVALDTDIDEELSAAGFAREVAHRLQALRREAGLEISDRVVVGIGLSEVASARLDPHLRWLQDEVLATEMFLGIDLDLPDAAARGTLDADGEVVKLAVRRA
jgi:isoleucyl-tRNA synthetase